MATAKGEKEEPDGRDCGEQKKGIRDFENTGMWRIRVTLQRFAETKRGHERSEFSDLV